MNKSEHEVALEKFPGVTEIEAVLGTHVGTAEQHYMLPFWLGSVKEGEGTVYEARIPSRAIVWRDQSKARVIAALLHGVAMLARDGNLDPNEPDRKGVPPIQHVLGILTDRLSWHVARRREHCDMKRELPPGATAYDTTAETRSNEVIAALGTAVSALARIKDL